MGQIFFFFSVQGFFNPEPYPRERERGTKTSTAAAYTGAAPEKNTALLQGQLQRNPRSGIPCFRRRGLNRYPRQQVLLSPCLHSRKSTPLRSARVRPPASGRSTLIGSR